MRRSFEDDMASIDAHRRAMEALDPSHKPEPSLSHKLGGMVMGALETLHDRVADMHTGRQEAFYESALHDLDTRQGLTDQQIRVLSGRGVGVVINMSDRWR
jgi:hypothetical protein